MQQYTAQQLTEAAAQQARVQQCIASVGDGLLMFQRKVEELEQRFATTGVPADHEDLLDFDDLTDEGSSDTSDGVPCTRHVEQHTVSLGHTVQEVKAQWHSLHAEITARHRN